LTIEKGLLLNFQTRQDRILKLIFHTRRR